MRIRAALAVAALTLGALGISGAAAAGPGCEPGDPNCNVGCEVINNTPVVNKIANCNT